VRHVALCSGPAEATKTSGMKPAFFISREMVFNKMKSEGKILQLFQLGALSAAHCTIDIFAGLLVIIMPAIQQRFSISMVMGITLISVMNITCNSIQLLTGHLREHKSTPLLLPLGFVLVISICFIALLPQSPVSGWLSLPLIIIAASGVGIVHPESLRAIHSINKFPPAITSSIFLGAGHFGYAVGGYIAAVLITMFGFKGLFLLIILAIIPPISIFLSRVRLAIEDNVEDAKYNNFKVERLKFGWIMLMAIPATTVPTVFCAMLPQKLNQLGFELTFGGLAVTVLVSGSIVGSFLWSLVAHRKGELFTLIIALLSGIPFLYAYLAMVESKTAIWLLFFGGLGSGSAYPLIVTLARYAIGFNLGRRMGFVVGGAWGTASLILWALGPVAKVYGIQVVLLITPICYLISAMVGLIILKKR